MAAKTSPQELMHLAFVLNREAARLDAVRDELREMVRATRGEWEGTVADRFRGHTGAEHRQHHLEVARDRLLRAARLMMEAANDVPGGGGDSTGGTQAPSGSGSTGGGSTGGTQAPSGGGSTGGTQAPSGGGSTGGTQAPSGSGSTGGGSGSTGGGSHGGAEAPRGRRDRGGVSGGGEG